MISLNIIAFDVPYPANYGGVIDVFYKIVSLKKLGVKITLHCFEYGKGEQEELEKYCVKIYYYKRKTSFFAAAFTHPYSVKSRINNDLLRNLKKNNAPILFESLQTCGLLSHPDLESRLKWVRTHNVEHYYYSGLSNYQGSKLKQLYYKKEARALEYFEGILKYADGLFCISASDTVYFKKYRKPTKYLPAFSQPGNVETVNDDRYALYHGNLAVEENIEAVNFLIDIFKLTSFSLIITGKNPAISIMKRLKKNNNITLRPNPTDQELNQLILNATVNCLPTFQSTGIKLKLIHALKIGNKVIANTPMIKGTGLEQFCSIANTKKEWLSALSNAFSMDLDVEEILERRKKVEKIFDNDLNAKHLVEWLELAQ